MGEATKIDIQELESSLQLLLSPEKTFGGFKSCIFKTPEILRRHNPKAYAPDAFSIGPMHYGEPSLEAAQEIKSLYVRDFLSRSTKERKFTLTTVIEVVERLEAGARACYAERLRFTRMELIEILVVDGCFLIELLYRSGLESDPDHPEDPVQTMACMYKYLYHDLVLLENQIPWFVLDGLFRETIREDPLKSTLTKLVNCFFYHHFSITNPLTELAGGNYEPKHILDFLRHSLVSPYSPEKVRAWRRTPSVVALSEAGVKLQPTKKQSTIFKVMFDKKNGVLEIPQLVITETTEATFRNLISYEQCMPECEPRVTSYVILMHNLIDRLADLEEMCQEEVVENWLDPEEATKLFNNLYSDTNVTEIYYAELSRDLWQYSNYTYSKWKAWFRRNYFTKPWAIISIVVGTVGLILTLLQTIFAIPGGGSKK